MASSASASVRPLTQYRKGGILCSNQYAERQRSRLNSRESTANDRSNRQLSTCLVRHMPRSSQVLPQAGGDGWCWRVLLQSSGSSQPAPQACSCTGRYDRAAGRRRVRVSLHAPVSVSRAPLVATHQRPVASSAASCCSARWSHGRSPAARLRSTACAYAPRAARRSRPLPWPWRRGSILVRTAILLAIARCPV